MPRPLLTAARMRELDRAAIEDVGIAGPILMEVAGRACADAVKELVPSHSRVAVVCGKGNNGGDGLVAARHLIGSGYEVEVFLLAKPEGLSHDAALNLGILQRLGHEPRVVTAEEQLTSLVEGRFDVVVDAILGTGLSSEVRGLYASAIDAMNEMRLPVVAVDVPSGVDSDTGRIMGRAVRAVRTVTFGHLKPGLFVYPGAGHAGSVSCVDIGIPPALFDRDEHDTWLVDPEDLEPLLRPRPADSHKGRFGHLLVVAGSAEKPGAAGLCCSAAVRAGAGLVSIAAPESVLGRVVSGPVEYMGIIAGDFEGVERAWQGKQAVAIGPGLGTETKARELVHRCVAECPLPMVVDADGLNNLAGSLELVGKSGAERVLTPHPGEAARLLDCTTADIQRDRLASARKLAAETKACVVLKGAGTVVAEPGGKAWVVKAGNPGMASGGTGDVLTGVIGSLLAQGYPPARAATLGALWHGHAADFALRASGEQALCAGDIVKSLGPALVELSALRVPPSK